jgi:ABC-2 family transporter protein
MIFLIVQGLIQSLAGRSIRDITDYNTALCYIFIVFMLFSFAVCSGLFIVTFVEERDKRLRHVFKVVGVNTVSYFFGNLLCDIVLFFICTAIFIALLYPLGLTFIYRDWLTTWGIISSFGFALICLTYLASFVFKNPTYAFNKIGMWYLIFGLVLPAVMTLILALVSLGISRDGNWIFTWMYVLLIDPFWPLA